MSQRPTAAPRRLPRPALFAAGFVLIGFIALQGVRFIIPDFQLDNPPVTRTVDWDSPETEALWRRACADCHSNETVYPWYAYIAPMGWLVAHDTHEGREQLNISEDSRIRSGELVEVIQKGEMPLPIYLPLHPDARLTDAEKAALIEGIRATFR